MPVVSLTRTRPFIGTLLVVSGALVAFGVVVQQQPGAVINGNWWWFDIAAAVLGLALVAIALSVAMTTVGVAAFWIGAAGWLVLALGVVLRVPVLSSTGAVLALAGGLVGAVFAVQEHALPRIAGILFLVAMVLGALYLLDFIAALLPPVLQEVERLAFGALLLLTGIFVLARR